MNEFDKAASRILREAHDDGLERATDLNDALELLVGKIIHGSRTGEPWGPKTALNWIVPVLENNGIDHNPDDLPLVIQEVFVGIQSRNRWFRNAEARYKGDDWYKPTKPIDYLWQPEDDDKNLWNDPQVR